MPILCGSQQEGIIRKKRRRKWMKECALGPEIVSCYNLPFPYRNLLNVSHSSLDPFSTKVLVGKASHFLILPIDRRTGQLAGKGKV